MNTAQTDTAPTTRLHHAAALAATADGDAADAEWLEFLALGLPLVSAQPVAGWRQAPVLLCY